MFETELKEVAFFGRITAAFTHEMKNVLAIIKESAGLMEDLLSLSQNAAFPHKDKFARTLATIHGQVKRGVDLSSRLNRFAHSPDEDVATIDLNEILEQIVFLSGRFARLQGVSLSLEPHEEALPVVVSPVGLQMVVFAYLECCWKLMSDGGSISLSVTPDKQEVIISFVCDGGAGMTEEAAGWIADAEAGLAIREMVKSSNCRIQSSASGLGLELILPVAGHTC
jgi:C4-dicarboxylate-specific signal transduction histidine kinase